jgi:hypothetical protein
MVREPFRPYYTRSASRSTGGPPALEDIPVPGVGTVFCGGPRTAPEMALAILVLLDTIYLDWAVAPIRRRSSRVSRGIFSGETR